jgi:hypothetical protein
MFGQLDTDADGKITYQEFLEVPPVAYGLIHL